MIRRLRHLREAERPSVPLMAQPREAIAQWLAGSAWVSVCAVLARTGGAGVLLVAVGLGFTMIWSWRRALRLTWFPAAAVIASALDLIAPSAAARSPVHAIDVVLAAFSVLASARLVAGKRWSLAEALARRSPVLLGSAGALVLASSAVLGAGEGPRHAALGLAGLISGALLASPKEAPHHPAPRERVLFVAVVIASFAGLTCALVEKDAGPLLQALWAAVLGYTLARTRIRLREAA